MKKTVVLFLFLAIVSCTKQPIKEFPASHEFIHVVGRTAVLENGDVVFAASGVFLEFEIEGDYVSVQFSKPAISADQYNWFQVVVDDVPTKRFRTEIGVNTYELARDLKPGKHTIRLVHDTEGAQGTVVIKSFLTQKIVQSNPEKQALIEFIGDSITCGFGAYDEQTPCKTGTWFDQHSASRAYGYLLAQKFNTKYMLSSVSGIGISRNWNSDSPTINAVYTSLTMNPSDYEQKWDFKTLADVVVIALGTNDFSDGDNPEKPRALPDERLFKNEYIRLISTVQSHYPKVKLLLTDSPMLQGEKKALLNKWLNEIKQQVEVETQAEVAVFQYEGYYVAGCDYHPSAEEQEKMATELEPAIKALMKW